MTTALAVAALEATAAAPSLVPFVADYVVRYGSVSVGTTRFELAPAEAPDRWVFRSRAEADGLARLVASGPLVQTSWVVVHDGEVLPQRFLFDDGSTRRKEDADLLFDWRAGRVKGAAKGRPVDLAVPPGTQDPVSSQLATMVALTGGREPRGLPIVDGGRLRETELVFKRRERVATPAGSFDTVVYTSRRPGGRRITWMWLAPELQYLPVQMEQLRDGKRAFYMQLTRYRAAG